MKIHDLKKGDLFRVIFPNGEKSHAIEFSHLDGMYSFGYITVKGKKLIVHPATDSEVELIPSTKEAVE